MKLEDQVCSLELSKKLRDLGVKQESAFWFCTLDGNKVKHRESCGGGNDHIAAFTVAELGEMLPSGVATKNSVAGLEMWTYGEPKINCVQYRRPDTGDYIPFECCSDTNEADARAKMLVYLIEQGIMKPQESKAKDKEIASFKVDNLAIQLYLKDAREALKKAHFILLETPQEVYKLMDSVDVCQLINRVVESSPSILQAEAVMEVIDAAKDYWTAGGYYQMPARRLKEALAKYEASLVKNE